MIIEAIRYTPKIYATVNVHNVNVLPDSVTHPSSLMTCG